MTRRDSRLTRIILPRKLRNFSLLLLLFVAEIIARRPGTIKSHGAISSFRIDRAADQWRVHADVTIASRALCVLRINALTANITISPGIARTTARAQFARPRVHRRRQEIIERA